MVTLFGHWFRTWQRLWHKEQKDLSCWYMAELLKYSITLEVKNHFYNSINNLMKYNCTKNFIRISWLVYDLEAFLQHYITLQLSLNVPQRSKFCNVWPENDQAGKWTGRKMTVKKMNLGENDWRENELVGKWIGGNIPGGIILGGKLPGRILMGRKFLCRKWLAFICIGGLFLAGSESVGIWIGRKIETHHKYFSFKLKYFSWGNDLKELVCA